MLDKEGYRPNVGIILANQRNEVPEKWARRARESNGAYRGQKQIWYLLRMTGRDCDVKLRASGHPEFDAWRWHEYWVPLEALIEFKRFLLTDRRARLQRALPVG